VQDASNSDRDVEDGLDTVPRDPRASGRRGESFAAESGHSSIPFVSQFWWLSCLVFDTGVIDAAAEADRVVKAKLH
jgi:hypothetical protein